MNTEVLSSLWVAWQSTPVEYRFLLVLAFAVAAAGLLRLHLDTRRD